MTARNGRHAAPLTRPYPARHRKPNRRPEVTTYYPSEAEIAVSAFLLSMRLPYPFL